ncbi:MAG TPA: (Fe-S)-binding protein [Phaeodactylibacter sp.]|nr:(Fe-S)-binding protein [Phaeodactylibacter sp.]
MKIPTMAEMAARGEKPEYLFWVGCAGSYDARAQKVVRAFCTLLQEAGLSFAILGEEESCTGDPARRAGNEFVFQMTALQNIEVLNGYGVTKIVTACPHCFNILKNEYPELGGQYELIHHTQLLQKLLDEGRLKVEGGAFKGKRLTYHDSCYLGRANGVYEAPRKVLAELETELIEMQRNRERGFCCGAGGGQMFKEEEAGEKRINTERADEALGTGAEVIAVNCPFCLTMLEDGLKARDKQDEVMVYDLSELILKNKK